MGRDTPTRISEKSLMLAETINVPSWLIPGLILLVIGGVVTIVTRAVFKSFREWIKGWFEDILKEVKPNGGTSNSLGDQVLQVKAVVTQVQSEQETVRADLDAFNGTLKDAVTRVEEGVSGLYPRMDSIELEQSRVKDELISLKKVGPDAEVNA